MLFHEQPTDRWEPWDFKILEAYQILQDETCPKCGHPVWICRADNNKLEFRVQADKCLGEVAMKQAEDASKPTKDRAKSADKKDWGVFRYSVPKMLFEAPLPTRAEYYESLATVE